MLMIEDLSAHKELDREAMASVYGGMGSGHYRPRKKRGFDIDIKDSFQINTKLDLTQVNDQDQWVDVNTGNNVAQFGKNRFNAYADVYAVQHGTNNNNINIG